MSGPAILKGGCYCGAATYEVEDDFAYSLYCHCSGCRRKTGAPYQSIAGIAIEKLRHAAPDAAYLVHGDEAAHDVHCATCGSLLYASVQNHTRANVAMGTLIDTPGIRPSLHMFVGSKAPWFEITDDLPQFEELPS